MAGIIGARRGGGWIVLLAALVAVAATARLGLWQLDRAAQKEALQAAIDTRAQLPALTAADLGGAGEAQHYRPIRLQGRWVADATLFLDNRQMHGRAGFYVVTPLRLADGSAVAVQRGWVPRNFEDRTQLPAIATPADTVEIEGRLAPPPSRLYDFGGAEAGAIRQNLDLAAYAQERRLKLRSTLSVQQTGDGRVEGLLRDWPAPALDVQKHYGYAFQWFAMATLITGLYVWFRVLRPRRVAAPR